MIRAEKTAWRKCVWFSWFLWRYTEIKCRKSGCGSHAAENYCRPVSEGSHILNVKTSHDEDDFSEIQVLKKKLQTGNYWPTEERGVGDTSRQEVRLYWKAMSSDAKEPAPFLEWLAREQWCRWKEVNLNAVWSFDEGEWPKQPTLSLPTPPIYSIVWKREPGLMAAGLTCLWRTWGFVGSSYKPITSPLMRKCPIVIVDEIDDHFDIMILPDERLGTREARKTNDTEAKHSWTAKEKHSWLSSG